MRSERLNPSQSKQAVCHCVQRWSGDRSKIGAYYHRLLTSASPIGGRPGAEHSASLILKQGLLSPPNRHLAGALRDQPRGALVARVDPQPAQRDAEPVAQADQEIDVGEAPDPPRESRRAA